MAGEKQSFATTKMQIRSTLTQLTIRARLCPNPTTKNWLTITRDFNAWVNRSSDSRMLLQWEGVGLL